MVCWFEEGMLLGDEILRWNKVDPPRGLAAGETYAKSIADVPFPSSLVFLLMNCYAFA